MAENTKLYDAISGLHETDSKIWAKTQEVSGTIGMNYFPDTEYEDDGTTVKESKVTSVVDTDGKISDRLLPGVTFNNKGELENMKMGSNIKFIGNCGVRTDSEGNLIIRIGDNLNSSNFATKDGQTTGVKEATVTAPGGTSGTNSAGNSVTAISGGNFTIKTETASAKLHFADNKSTTFEVVVNDGTANKTLYFGPITGSATYTGKDKDGNTVAGTSLTVSNFGVETKSSEGAEGYCGSVSFTIAASAIANGSTTNVKIVSITHKNGSEGNFTDNSLAANTRYFYTNTTTKPTISSSSVTVTSSGSKTVSGVKYLTGATANYSVSFTDIATPVCIADNVSFDANGWAADATNLDAAYNATSLSGSGAVANGQHAQANNTVKVTVKNINGSVSGVATLADYSLLVDSNNTSDTALIAYFDKEDSANYPRLTNDSVSGLIAFDKTKNIKTTSDLMLSGSCLMYPQGNFTGYNTILGTDFTQPDYSTGLTTGKRTWYRKFYEAGDKNGATLTFAASSNIDATAFDSTLTVKIGVLNSTGAVSAWYNACKKSTQAADGIATSVTQNVLKVDWGAYGAAKYGIIIELGMTAASHNINTLTVTFA